LRSLTLKQWATLYGVAFCREREGFCRWTATLSYKGRVLRRENLIVPFGPTLRDALEPLVRPARRADAMGGSFYAYLETCAPGRRLEDYRQEFRPLVESWELLRRWCGEEAANKLIWAVRF
jgi:hypothetical protein